MGWSINRPTGLTWHLPNLSTKGYTLLTPHGDDTCYLIDMAGCIVHTWRFSRIRPGSGCLLDNGNLLMSGSDVTLPDPPEDEPHKPPLPFERHITRLGGYHTTLQEVDWDGNVVWEYVNHAQHHDFHRFANGNTMVPVWVELPEELHKRVRGGYKKPRERLPHLLGDDLVEVDPQGQEVRRIETWKLLDPIRDPIDPATRRWEWTHLNGFDVNTTGDIVISCRNTDIVAVIDATSGQIRSKFRETHGQHNPSWLDNGHILVFDNGFAGSRVLEFDPAANEITWSYQGRPVQQFFSGHISGVQQLPSGNCLVCEGTSGRLFEVTRNQEVVWEWINPFANNNRKGEPTVNIYRAYRYLPDHPALRDRDLSVNRYRKLNSLNGLA